MSDQTPPPPPPPGYLPATNPYARGPIGRVRSTGVCILLAIVTLGIYPIVWWYQVHEEMKRHTGRGLGGGVPLALLVVSFVVGVTGFIPPFFTSDEVGKMQEAEGRPTTVSALTGLWFFPGVFILVGPIIWFVKTNGALNEYWASHGAAA